MVSVIEMTNFYDARGLFWSLRPQNTIKLPTQSALGQICIGEWPVPSLHSGIVFQASERPKTFRFFRGSVCYQCDPCKNHTKVFRPENSLRDRVRTGRSWLIECSSRSLNGASVVWQDQHEKNFSLTASRGYLSPAHQE